MPCDFCLPTCDKKELLRLLLGKETKLFLDEANILIKSKSAIEYINLSPSKTSFYVKIEISH